MPSCYHTDNGAKFLSARLEFEAKMLTYYLKLYFCTLLAFCAIDMVWLGLIAKGFYRREIGGLMRAEVNWPAAVAFTV